MGHHIEGQEHPIDDESTPNTAAEPAVGDGTDPNETVVSDDIDQEMLAADVEER